MPVNTPTKGRGTVIAIGTTAANHLTDTYTTIGDCNVLSAQIGGTDAEWDVTTFADQYKQVMKTVTDGGDIELGGLYANTDAGQTALQAAFDNKDSVTGYNLRITLATGRKIYLRGQVMSFVKVAGAMTSGWTYKSKVAVVAAAVETA